MDTILICPLSHFVKAGFNLSLLQVKVVVREEGLDVMETVQKEVATEAVAAVALTVAVMTVVDTTVVEGVDLLVWGKLHSATAPKVPPCIYTDIST